jgi:hypothetical protein
VVEYGGLSLTRKLQTIKLRGGLLKVSDKPKNCYVSTFTGKEEIFVNGGWKSDYDKENQSNLEKLCGRQLHVQDNFWNISKILIVVFTAVIIYVVITSGSDLLDGVRNFLTWIK